MVGSLGEVVTIALISFIKGSCGLEDRASRTVSKDWRLILKLEISF